MLGGLSDRRGGRRVLSRFAVPYPGGRRAGDLVRIGCGRVIPGRENVMNMAGIGVPLTGVQPFDRAPSSALIVR
jgi:hypothetical protein